MKQRDLFNRGLQDIQAAAREISRLSPNPQTRKLMGLSLALDALADGAAFADERKAGAT